MSVPTVQDLLSEGIEAILQLWEICRRVNSKFVTNLPEAASMLPFLLSFLHGKMSLPTRTTAPWFMTARITSCVLDFRQERCPVPDQTDEGCAEEDQVGGAGG